MTQVELMVPSSCVDLVDADELPVPRIPGWGKKSLDASSVYRTYKMSYLLKKLPGPVFLSKMI